MPNSQLHTAISEPRYHRYLSACGNRSKALKLYRANIVLSQKLYGVIDRYMIGEKGNMWLEEAVMEGGYLDIVPGCDDAYHSVQDAINKLNVEYTHDRLIAKLTFGFWTYQFAAKEFAASGSILLNIFPNRSFGTSQKDIFKKLIKINIIRNRIAHYEPVCFSKENKTCTINVEKTYAIIIELLEWLGCTPKKILYGVDGVLKAVRAINKL